MPDPRIINACNSAVCRLSAVEVSSSGSVYLVKGPAILGTTTVGERCVRAVYKHLFTQTHTHTHTHTHTNTHKHTEYEDT